MRGPHKVSRIAAQGGLSQQQVAGQARVVPPCLRVFLCFLHEIDSQAPQGCYF